MTVVDQFESKSFDVLQPHRLCLPANTDDQSPGAETHVAHLLCYSGRSAPNPRSIAGPMFVADQFGSRIDQVSRRLELCVPSLKGPTTTTTTVRVTTTSTSTVSTMPPPVQCCTAGSAGGAFDTCNVVPAGTCTGIAAGPGTCSPNPCPPSTTTTVPGTTSTTSTSVPGTTTTTMPPLGPRSFTVTNGAEPAGSHFTIATGDNNGFDAENANTFVGSLALTADAPDANGVAPLSLASDSLLGFQAADNSIVCLRFHAAGSGGKVDCNGGTPVGVTLTQNSNGTGADSPPVLATEQGPAGGAGDGYVTFTADFVQCTATNCPMVTTPSDCLNAAKPNYAAGRTEMSAATTGTATATITNARQGGTATLSKTGQPFSCATWTTDGPGILEIPVAFTDAPVLNQDLAVVLQLDD